MALSLALVGNFDLVCRRPGRAAAAAALRAGTDMLAAVGRASVRWELDEEAGDLADQVPAVAQPAGPVGDVAAALDLPLVQALRDAMSLVWRVLLAWLAVLALFVVAGWVN